jgi:hypothetical protein
VVAVTVVVMEEVMMVMVGGSGSSGGCGGGAGGCAGRCEMHALATQHQGGRSVLWTVMISTEPSAPDDPRRVT